MPSHSASSRPVRPADLGAALESSLPGRVHTRLIDRVAWANDASVYRLVPRAIVFPRSEEQVQTLFEFSHRWSVPLTFRAAGTSLSGQAVTDGILVVLSRDWSGLEIEDAGRRVRVQPGIIGGMVNRHLEPFGTKLGPDPASINACMIGGILANNSSGMCCGIEHNAYRTLESMRCILPDGRIVDSAPADAEERLARSAPDLARGLLELRDAVRGDLALSAEIRRKFGMKNTMGYSLNAFLDYDQPAQILTHLMIGSEGTLGFIAQATLRTVPDFPLKHTGLLFFDDVPRACAAIEPLRASGARALELMDRASLRAVERQPGMPPGIAGLPAQAAALLVEYQCATEDELAQQVEACDAAMPGLALAAPATFTRDPLQQAALWRVRKGLIPSVGAMRARGTSFIIEDVVFPVARLAGGVIELQRLFVDFGYDDAILFGHAKDGNLHFVLTQAFDVAADVARYDGFMQALAELVAVRYGGALKAEHGTGRNMAPFVGLEWGPAALAIMRRIKRLFDPHGLLNPGVILNEDPQVHIRDLKALPEIEAEVDQCIECGFCERVCPSRELTLTPRQRIVVRREMARLRGRPAAAPELAQLEQQYVYSGVETCATDGLCALACPVGIDTGNLVRRLRRTARADWADELAHGCAARFALVERGARAGLHALSALRRLGLAPRKARPGAAGGSRLALLLGELPAAARWTRTVADDEAQGIYFPSCVTRILGRPPGEDDVPLQELVLRLSRRADAALRVPDDVTGHCCGLPFASKGFERAAARAAADTLAALWRWSDGGRWPVVCDASPCARTLKLAAEPSRSGVARRFADLRILDGIEFARDRVVGRLQPRRRLGRVAVHPVCAVSRQGLEPALRDVAQAFADHVEVPLSAGCCGFAGDAGYRRPELTAAALRGEARELLARPYDGYFCSSRTCEIGLTRATGKPFRSFWHLIGEATAD